jgi:3-methyladenine DNA glycosylase/8-oxoguanine DNA glycosylase
MVKTTITFECPKFYDLYMTCHVHGWKNLAPFSWDDKKNLLRFSALVENQPVDIEAKQSGQTLKATITSHQKLDRSSKSQAKTIITRSLGLDIDTAELLSVAKKTGPEYVKLIKKGAGRLLRAPSLWEDAAKTLFTTNCTWALTQKMCESACSKTFIQPAPSGAYPFPSPDKFVKYQPEELKQLMPVGYRAAYLNPLAKTFADDPTLEKVETNGFDYKSADKLVRDLKGFADYATAHLLILAGYYNEIPIDTVVVSYLKKNHRVRKPKSFIDRHYHKWGKYKWWGFKLEKMLNHQNWLGG